MSSQQTRYASSIILSEYTDGANVYSQDTTYAVWTSNSRNATASLEVGISAFDIPTGSTINSVTIYMLEKWSSGASSLIEYGYMQAAYSSVLRGSQYSESSYSTTDYLASVDAGTWTVADLNSSNIEVHIDTERLNNSTSTTHSIDVIYMIVDYDEPSILQNLKIAEDTPSAAYFGADSITTIYLGSDKIWGF